MSDLKISDQDYHVKKGSTLWSVAKEICNKNQNNSGHVSNADIVKEMKSLAKLNDCSDFEELGKTFNKIGNTIKIASESPTSELVASKKNVMQDLKIINNKNILLNKNSCHSTNNNTNETVLKILKTNLEKGKSNNIGIIRNDVSVNCKKAPAHKNIFISTETLKAIDHKNIEIANNPSMTKGQKIAAIAKEELNSKCTKYNRGYTRYTKDSNYHPWCTDFATFVVNKATGNKNLFGHQSSTSSLQHKAEQKNRFAKFDEKLPINKQIKVGDILLMKRHDTGHAAIVIAIKDEQIYTVEGGVSDRNSPTDERIIKTRVYNNKGKDITDNIHTIAGIVRTV